MPTSPSSTATRVTPTKASLQSSSAASPPTSGAEVCPAACSDPNQPSARPNRSGGTVAPSAASSSGVVNALATPCSARPARNRVSVPASTQATEASTYTA